MIGVIIIAFVLVVASLEPSAVRFLADSIEWTALMICSLLRRHANGIARARTAYVEGWKEL